jgi:UMF1 family MFS transporter
MARSSLLARVGLRTPEQRAWAMYDWANSAMIVVVVTAIFPIFFAAYAGAGLTAAQVQFRFSATTTIALAIIALASPILGTIADHVPIKKTLLGAFLALGVSAIALMFFIPPGGWRVALILFLLANVGANGSFVFYDSLLPHVAGDEEIDRVSTAGYALGYVGGGLLLLLSLLLVLYPSAVGLPAGDDLSARAESLPARLSFLATAVWWAGFAIPLFRRVPEPVAKVLSEAERAQHAVRAAFGRLAVTFRELRKFRNAFLLLVAFLIYNDGIGTIIRMATLYGESIGIDRTMMIGAVVLVQFVGIPFAFAFGQLAGRIGAKAAIFIGLATYVAITFVGYFMTTAVHFFVLAALVGMVQGGTQALSRSLFGSMIPRHASGEFFGLFAVFEKFAGILGPATFALMIALTGSARTAILTVVAFFVVGAALLMLVDVDEGRRVARAAEGA